MTSMVVLAGVDNKIDVWHIDTTQGLAQAQVWPATDVPLQWVDGTLETIPARTRCLTNPGSAGSVDISTLDYFIVTYKGAAAAGVAPSIVPITALGTLDTLFSGQTWQLLAAFGKWGSRSVGLSGAVSSLPGGTEGQVLYFDPALHQWVGMAPVKGDILRGENIGGSLQWRRYPLSAGSQNYVLLNDKDQTGEPIWGSITAALAPTTPGSAQTYSQVGIDRMLYLWNGTSNDPTPTGWTDLAFNDSAWGLCSAAMAGFGGSPPSPSASVWCTGGGPTPGGATGLLRRSFSLTGGAITACTLHLYVDDQIDGAWINGHLVQGPFSGGGGIDAIITFGGSGPPLSWLNANGNNVLAVQHTNVIAPGAFIAYVLTVTQPGGSGGPGAPPIPATALPIATTSSVGVVLVDQSPPSGYPVALTATRLGAASGVADLDSSGHVPITRLSGITHSQIDPAAGITHSQLDAAAGITAGQIASVNPSALTGSGTVPLPALSGITHSQLDAAAGIVHGQISSVDAADLVGAGTLPVGVLPSSVPITLGTPTNGTMMVYNLGFWLMLAPGANGKVLTMVGGLPTWS